jgi:hypothetical protein
VRAISRCRDGRPPDFDTDLRESFTASSFLLRAASYQTFPVLAGPVFREDVTHRGMLSDMPTSRTFPSLAPWSVWAFAIPLLTSMSIESVQAQSSPRPFWTEQAMFRVGGALYFVGVASCARTAEEGRRRAFEGALHELRAFAQDRDTSRLLVDTQMIYEEPNSPVCPHGSTSVWRLLHVDQSKLAHLPRRPRAEAQERVASAPAVPPEPHRQDPIVHNLTPLTGMSRDAIVQRFGTPDITKKRGREEVWQYLDIGLTITFSPKETLINWKFDGARALKAPPPELAQMARPQEPELATSRPSPIEPVPPPPPPLVFPENRITQGRSLFNGKGGCNTCHGRDADMFTDVQQDLLFGSPPGYAPFPFTVFGGPAPRRAPPNLRDWFVLKRRTDLDMARAIKDGIAGTTMTATRHLTDSEIAALVAYLNSLR